MKKLAFYMGIVILFSIFAQAQGKNNYVSTCYGFSMNVPSVKDNINISHQIAFFFLPMSDGFAPNVNVQIQAFEGTIDDYDRISTNQFKSFSFILISRMIKKDFIIYEYKGITQEKKMHWYQKAVKKENHIFLITATALETQWMITKTSLIDSVDSFKFVQ